jgi:Tfp pilus assembly protein PilE
MKKGFSFVEVIISVMILSFMGVAILNFNSFNKKAMTTHIDKQKTILISSPMLYLKDTIESTKTYKLSELITFNNLSDEDRSFLKNIEFKATQEDIEKVFLYTDGDKEYYIEYGYKNIKYNEKNHIPYLFLERTK